jgi:hypothetical protein
LFLANIGWPLLLIPGLSQADTAIDFWQVYFISLPHRWVTLVLVVADADRREGRGRLLAVVAILSAVLVVGAYLGTGAFICLALADYLWNAWHFGSQHGGVLRMYARKVGGGFAWLERWGVRGMVVYAAVRAASWSVGWAAIPSLSWLPTADLAVLAIPAVLILANLFGMTRDRGGKLAYLGSVCLLYSGLILAVWSGRSGLVLALAAAGSLFHAIEYLAVVTHYAHRRRTVGTDGLFRTLAEYWLLFLACYVLVIGSVGAMMAHPESGLVVAWQGLNLWASFVHYVYDGMIWKLRRPATAAALGVAT